MSKVLALVREDLGSGFSLAGVEIRKVADAAALRPALEAAFATRAYGIVIVEEEMVTGLGEEARASLRARTLPLVLTVPGEMTRREGEEAAADDYVARLIRRAVGYQLNIKL